MGMKNVQYNRWKAEVRDLAAKGVAFAEDPDLTPEEKDRKLKSIEGRIAPLRKQIEEEDYVAAQRERLAPIISPSGVAEPGGTFIPAPETKRMRGAPSLAFTERDLKELHTAATRRQMFSKAVGSTQAPMAAIPAYPLEGPALALRDRTRIAALIPTEPTLAGRIDYFRALAPADQAGPVAEGADKPESNPTWQTVVAPVTKIAHYVRATEEVLADFPAFADVIQTELVAGVIDAENNQILNGSGVAPEMTGLLATTGVITRARGTDTVADAVFRGITDLRVGASFSEPDAVVMHPNDLATVRLSKNTAGDYVAGDPTTASAGTLWGVPVVPTTTIPAGTALVANLAEACRLFLREPPRVDINPLGGEAEFRANITLIRCEERIALATVRPKSLVVVTGLGGA